MQCDLFRIVFNGETWDTGDPVRITDDMAVHVRSAHVHYCKFDGAHGLGSRGSSESSYTLISPEHNDILVGTDGKGEMLEIALVVYSHYSQWFAKNMQLPAWVNALQRIVNRFEAGVMQVRFEQ